MGINPRGLGLLLSSRQLQRPLDALIGLRWPFDVPFASATSTFRRTGLPAADGIPDFELIAVKPLIRLLFMPVPSRTGLRLLARARFSGSRSEPELSSSGIVGDFAREPRAIERVMGPKYPSLLLGVSEGVGEGEMTRGVEGIG